MSENEVQLNVVVNGTNDPEVNCLHALAQVVEHFELGRAARARAVGWLYERYGSGDERVGVASLGEEPRRRSCLPLQEGP